MHLPGWRVAAVATLVLLLPSFLPAQGIPMDRPGARQRVSENNKPAKDAKIDDALKKWESPEMQERLEALEQFGQLPDEPKAVAALLGAVTEPEPALRVKAIDVLGTMRAQDAVPVLVQQLMLRDTPMAAKQHMLAALGQIGDPRAVSPLLDFLASNADNTLRGSAIFALGEIGDRGALQTLEQAQQDGASETLKRLAGEAVQKIKDRPLPSAQPPSLAGDRRGPRPR